MQYRWNQPLVVRLPIPALWRNWLGNINWVTAVHPSNVMEFTIELYCIGPHVQLLRRLIG